MLKRIFVIGLFTGAGQLFSILVLKFVSQHGSLLKLNEIGQLDSLVFFIMNIVAFGLQSATIRNIALSHNWKEDYHNTQSARLTLGLILMVVSLLALINKYYLVFLIAPVFALSGEYALYARGAAIFGAVVSFLRLTVSFSAVMLAVYFFPAYTGVAYAVALLSIYLITNYMICYFLKVPFFATPKLNSLKLYFQSFQLGLVTICLYFIGLGLIIVIPYFYTNEIVAVTFIGLKFYVLYKGILRIIHQAFVKEMTDEVMCLRVDQLSIMIGFVLLGSVVLFPGSFITFFFGRQYLPETNYFLSLAIGAMIYSFFLSLSTRSLLQKKDRVYSIVTVIAFFVTLVSSVVLAFFWQTPLAIGVSICAGELTWMVGLYYISSNVQELKNRFVFALEIALLLAVPFGIRYFFGDVFLYYAIAFSVFSAILLILHHKKFKLL